jgi:transposase
MPRKRKTKVQSIQPVINPHAAGADIGAREIYVAVPTALTSEPVRCFPTFTEDLRALVAWLQSFGIKTVAMEATSVYWIPLAELLEEAGIEVCLVNPRHVKNVPGRKTDVMDCQWLQYLHSVGLLRGAFRPAAEVRGVRALWRQRDALVRHSSWHIQHVHKALDQMNLQVHHVLADITGQTGTAIVEAILKGERDPGVLAQHRDQRVKASAATLAKALTGDYRAEHLFCRWLSIPPKANCRTRRRTRAPAQPVGAARRGDSRRCGAAQAQSDGQIRSRFQCPWTARPAPWRRPLRSAQHQCTDRADAVE